MNLATEMLRVFVPMLKAVMASPAAWLIALMALLVAIYNLPVVKGAVGEWVVNMHCRLFLPKSAYTMVPNVTIPDGQGGTTQIDHVVVSRFGVFVVETKNKKGWIFGGERDREWTQKFRRSSYRFQNPLRQNFKHTETLAELLGLTREKVVSVIAFVGDCRIKTPEKMPHNVKTNAGWVTFVKEHREPLLTEDEVTSVLQRIAEARLAPGFRTHREHVRYVKGLKDRPTPSGDQGEATVAVAAKVDEPPGVAGLQPASPVALPMQEGSACPACGGRLIARTARRGANAGNSFLGCSNYPRCRHVEEPDRATVPQGG